LYSTIEKPRGNKEKQGETRGNQGKPGGKPIETIETKRNKEKN